MTRERLLDDLHQAYRDARRHKGRRIYVVRFEERLEQNLEQLCDELLSRTYKPAPATCFIITEPKKREVFAADFRDRIVHHLYYNYTHELYERTFIADSYSCIKRRGTLYGVKRLYAHIRKESQNYSVPCYVLQMDICGYFMHINRKRLLQHCLSTLDAMQWRRVSRHRRECWAEVMDVDFVRYLTEEIVLLNPVADCRVKGNKVDWHDLPNDKSLFCTDADCGLPIGNLTSQLFSNIYLNLLDQYAKRVLGCRRYGRYVDDFYVVSADREFLEEAIGRFRQFLAEHLELTLHEGKTKIVSVWHGVAFLGYYLKPHRYYVSRALVARIRQRMADLSREPQRRVHQTIMSYKGILSHGRNHRLTEMVFRCAVLYSSS